MTALLRFTAFVQKTFALWVVVFAARHSGRQIYLCGLKLIFHGCGDHYVGHGNDHVARRFSGYAAPS